MDAVEGGRIDDPGIVNLPNVVVGLTTNVDTHGLAREVVHEAARVSGSPKRNMAAWVTGPDLGTGRGHDQENLSELLFHLSIEFVVHPDRRADLVDQAASLACGAAALEDNALLGTTVLNPRLQVLERDDPAGGLNLSGMVVRTQEVFNCILGEGLL